MFDVTAGRSSQSRTVLFENENGLPSFIGGGPALRGCHFGFPSVGRGPAGRVSKGMAHPMTPVMRQMQMGAAKVKPLTFSTV